MLSFCLGATTTTVYRRGGVGPPSPCLCPGCPSVAPWPYIYPCHCYEPESILTFVLLFVWFFFTRLEVENPVMDRCHCLCSSFPRLPPVTPLPPCPHCLPPPSAGNKKTCVLCAQGRGITALCAADGALWFHGVPDRRSGTLFVCVTFTHSLQCCEALWALISSRVLDP